MRGRVEEVSSFYRTPPHNEVQGPDFLNVAARYVTDLEPAALEAFTREVERAVGRRSIQPLAARPIDIDLLIVDGGRENDVRSEFRGPDFTRRPYNLIPLAEIAPGLIDPRSGKSIAELTALADRSGIEKKRRSLHFHANRQDEMPEVRLGIERVGVSRVRRMMRAQVGGSQTAFAGEFSMVADLAPDKAGVHMSRFSELLEQAVADVLGREGAFAHIENLASQIAGEIVHSQKAVQADVRLRGEFALERWTPVSGKRCEEIYTLIAIAHADAHRVRHVIGVEAEGMTACPCAQALVREQNFSELCEAGFSHGDAERALNVLPAATHNQRGRGMVLIGTGDGRDVDIRVEDLVEIVEGSMSSETYDLLKRPDEFFVVNKAHHHPKFVEDVVRGIMARTLEVYEDFPDEAFIATSHVNYESIHKHDAFAQTSGTFGELRRELESGVYRPRKTDLAAWLGTRPSVVVT
jgi:GTP cyclohydrolase-4